MTTQTPSSLQYVLVTPARNEASTMPAVIASVAAQTQRPLRWAIVDDASADGTGDAIARGAAAHPFIQPLRLERGGARDNSGGKLAAVRAGYAALRGLGFGFVGQLDADITFGPAYYAALIAHMTADPALGIAGGVLLDVIGGVPRATRPSRDHVAGGIQFYRRACFEDILDSGLARDAAEDFVAEAHARMRGWRTRAFGDCGALHWRPTQGGLADILRARFRTGAWQHATGWHPLYVALRALHRAFEPPALIGSAARTLGYCAAAAARRPRSVPPELMAYIRAEQRAKLRTLVRRGRYPWQGLAISGRAAAPTALGVPPP